MKVLITGGTGTLGRALVRKINNNFFIDGRPDKVIIYSRDEYKQLLMQQEYEDVDNLRFFIGDVRDEKRLVQALDGIDYCIHAAALKQIPTIEYNPTEAIKTNVEGSMNVVNASLKCGVKKAVLISTDKACRPVNLYGATKLAAEKLFKAANAFNKTKFSIVRYGNVIASRGSVIELFLKLKKQGIKEFPITDLEMTRFWITTDEAIELVRTAFLNERTGLFIPCAKSLMITDVAKCIEPECTFQEIGIRPGEKLHEDLTCDEDGEYWIGGCLSKWSSGAIRSNLWRSFMKKEEFLEKLNG